MEFRPSFASSSLNGKPSFIAAIALMFACSAANAATFTWNGGGTDVNWSTGKNWVGGVVPNSNDGNQPDVVFTGNAGLTPNQDISTPFEVTTLSFDAAANAFTLGGRQLQIDSTLTQSSNKAQIINNNIAAGQLTLTGDGTGLVTIHGVISGNNSLTKDGASTYDVAAVNTYIGDTIIRKGTLQISVNDALPAANALRFGATPATSGTLELNDFDQTVTDLSGAGDIQNTGFSTSTFTLNNTNNATFDGVISGDVDFVKAGGFVSQITFTKVQTYTGSTKISMGTIQSGVFEALPTETTLDVEGIFDMNGHDQTVAEISGSGSIGSTFTPGPTDTPPTFTVDSNNDSTFDGTIGNTNGRDSMTLAKDGTGTLDLGTKQQQYFGPTNVLGGTLQGLLPADTTLNVSKGATFDLDDLNVKVAAFNGDGTITNDGLAPATFTVKLQLNDTVGTILAGNLNFVKDGPASLLMTEPCTYTGSTSIVAGTLTINNDNVLPATTTVSVAANTTFNVQPGVKQTIAGLTGAGTVDGNGSTTMPTLTINTTANCTFDGKIIGLINIVKSGAAKFTLTGNSTYSTTTINGGTLLVNGAISSPVTINAGGTLGGSGKTGAVTNNGGKIAPGNSPGILSTGDLLLNKGSTLEIEIAGTTVGTQYDQVNVTGAVTIDGANPGVALSVLLSYDPTPNDSFIIVNNDANDAVTGTFAGLAEAAMFNVTNSSDGKTFAFSITYKGGDGNDIVLTAGKAVPEPATLLLLAAGAPVLASRRQKRTAC
ncbi:MAG TPA: autotransporter-associated beta strand repeat-containing protein [Phycisphaerae bacterium]|nr:autotransporter-associated beta strand repeat-containing protein [Phycisphaerae bacterium]